MIIPPHSSRVSFVFFRDLVVVLVRLIVVIVLVQHMVVSSWYDVYFSSSWCDVYLCDGDSDEQNM